MTNTRSYFRPRAGCSLPQKINKMFSALISEYLGVAAKLLICGYAKRADNRAGAKGKN